eukprot:COSAG06_NODE_16345_length_1006_cov_0.891951_1_plen_29_part_10
MPEPAIVVTALVARCCPQEGQALLLLLLL